MLQAPAEPETAEQAQVAPGKRGQDAAGLASSLEVQEPAVANAQPGAAFVDWQTGVAPPVGLVAAESSSGGVEPQAELAFAAYKYYSM